MILKTLKRWLGFGRKPKVQIKEYEGSTALIVENERLDYAPQVWYIQKWDAPCDKVIERLEGTEYELVE